MILPVIDRSTEVEDILSGKVLDTDIPGLEELMSTESKCFQRSNAQINCHIF